jgi:histidinol-phosphatase (PHP family)
VFGWGYSGAGPHLLYQALVHAMDGSVAPATDGHVHAEWSWDCEPGDMEASCAQALAVGLPVNAFTEHFTVWTNVEPAPDAPAKVTNLIRSPTSPGRSTRSCLPWISRCQ